MSFDKFHLECDDGICSIVSRYLHRYHTIDQNFINSLKRNYLWFSDPLDFNDPYDCNLDFDFENTPEEIEGFAREINETPENVYRKMNEIQLQNRVNQLIENPEIFHQAQKDNNLEMIKEIGICCFSENDDMLLMWSHYGDKHKGVCLTFDANIDQSLFMIYPYCVEYPKKFPIYNWIRDKGTFKVRRFEFATKSSEWSYENEVRIIKDHRYPPYRGEVKFDKNALVSVKFGYKTSLVDQLKVRDTLSQTGGYEHVKFYLAKLKRLDFGIEYEEIFI
jgi:hypothetical protein